MIINERESRHEHLLTVARQIMTAARTAPKAKGVDIVEMVLLTDDDIKRLSDKMLSMAEENGMKFFIRDAGNILNAECLLLIGTRLSAQGLNCGYCGFPTCGAKPKAVPCALNATDVGIAIGSAVSMAADLRIDTRVMFSAGLAAKKLNILPDCTNIYAIPMSAGSKNPFFDRK